MDKNQELITKTNLKDRGWTESLISKFLPEPDKIKRNPIYRCASPMKLYAIEKVEQTEASEPFKVAQEKLVKRREGAKKAADSKRAETMGHVDNIKIKVPKIPEQTLIALACKHYNDWNSYKDNWSGDLATKDSDKSFLQRITINFLRHEMTKYEYHLDEVHGKVGTSDAYFAIKNKVFDAISKQYPWLTKKMRKTL